MTTYGVRRMRPLKIGFTCDDIPLRKKSININSARKGKWTSFEVEEKRFFQTDDVCSET